MTIEATIAKLKLLPASKMENAQRVIEDNPVDAPQWLFLLSNGHQYVGCGEYTKAANRMWRKMAEEYEKWDALPCPWGNEQA